MHGQEWYVIVRKQSASDECSPSELVKVVLELLSLGGGSENRSVAIGKDESNI